MGMQYSLFSTREDSEKPSQKAPDKAETMAGLDAEIAQCKRCRLHSTRTNTVPGEGNLDAKLMFIGEGPGADEDIKGRPFVGAAGHLLDKIVSAMGFTREDVFIGNIVKCRPPSNRLPESDEIDSCIGFLKKQMEVVQPKIIILLGATAYKAMFPEYKEGITKARGNFLTYGNIACMPTFHPAALLRDPSKKAEVWADMKKVLSLLNEEL